MLRNILLVALGGAIGSVWFFVAKLRLTGKDTKWTCHCDTSTSLYCVVFELAIRVGRLLFRHEAGSHGWLARPLCCHGSRWERSVVRHR